MYAEPFRFLWPALPVVVRGARHTTGQDAVQGELMRACDEPDRVPYILGGSLRSLLTVKRPEWLSVYARAWALITNELRFPTTSTGPGAAARAESLSHLPSGVRK